MPLTQAKIANLALNHLGVETIIENLTEDSQEAKTLNLHYDNVLSIALAQADWPFARRLATLVLAAGDPPAPWGYQYAYPENVVRPLRIDDQLKQRADENRIPFELRVLSTDQKVILTDQIDACLIYTYLETDSSRFSEPFGRYLSHELAAAVASPLVRDVQAVAQAVQRARFELQEALSIEYRGEQDSAPLDASWILDRQ